MGQVLNHPERIHLIVEALPKGNIYELGRALTGGLIGGPVGGLLLNEVMKLGGRVNFKISSISVGNLEKRGRAPNY